MKYVLIVLEQKDGPKCEKSPFLQSMVRKSVSGLDSGMACEGTFNADPVSGSVLMDRELRILVYAPRPCLKFSRLQSGNNCWHSGVRDKPRRRPLHGLCGTCHPPIEKHGMRKSVSRIALRTLLCRRTPYSVESQAFLRMVADWTTEHLCGDHLGRGATGFAE